MAILDCIAENGCDASETLTPPGMGGDADHGAIRQRLGNKLCLIGGLDQLRVLEQGSRSAVRSEVNRLFQELGTGGGYIMSPAITSSRPRLRTSSGTPKQRVPAAMPECRSEDYSGPDSSAANSA